MRTQTFPKTARLRKSSEFQHLYKNRCSAANDVLIVLACPNDLGRCRLGLSVSKKVGNSPVRNRWKRLIREAFRKRRSKFVQNLDIVVIPQKSFVRGSTPPGADVVEKTLVKLVAKIVRRLESRG